MASSIKEKELKTDWDELTASDSSKAEGKFKLQLEAQEGSIVLSKERVGL